MLRCTVAIPTYNREDMIRGTLESALMQDLDGLEILVIDDQSQDRVLEIAATYNDPRLKLIRNERNLGLFGNFNRCLEVSKGAFVRILCNDDRLTKGCLRREVELMEENSDVSLLFSKGLRVGKNRMVLGTVGDHIPAGLYQSADAVRSVLWFLAHYGINPITLPSGVLLRKSACDLAGRFDESMKMDGDLDYFLRVVHHGKMAVLGDVGCEISVHSEQVSSKLQGDATIIRESYSVIDRNANFVGDKERLARLIAQHSAIALLFACKLSMLGQFDRAREHYELARRWCPDSRELMSASLRSVTLHLGLKYFGRRSLPESVRRIA
jgi:glycosyltransferase involved in cell wall biosynthesis